MSPDATAAISETTERSVPHSWHPDYAQPPFGSFRRRKGDDPVSIRRFVVCGPLRRQALFIVVIFLSSLSLFAQEPVDTTRVPVDPTDTAVADSAIVDSVRVTTGGTFDKLIVYSARDSIIFTIDRKKAYLYGDAVVSTGADKLQAAYIEIDFETKELYAEVRYDSVTGEYVGLPVLNYGGEEVTQEWLKYNFETGRGVSASAESMIEDGFFHADRVKRVSPNVAFAQNGKYTTCDAPHPHFYFAASEMKLITDDKIYADRLQLYIEDVPIITLPVGVFFALGGGRHSGIILPDPSFTEARGAELRGLGYFWAINDYLDTRFTADLSTQAGYNINNLTRFRLRGIVTRSDLSVRFGRSRTSPDAPMLTSWIVGYSHQQKIGKNTNLGGSLNYSTQDAIRQTTTEIDRFSNIDDITIQEVQSNFSFSSQADLFGLTIPYGFDYRRSQNIVTRAIDPESFSGNLRLPTWTPFSRNGPDVLSTLSLGFSMDATRSFVRRDTLPGGGFRTEDTRYGANLRPTFSWTPKLSYFTVSPRFTLNSSIFTRRIVKQPDGMGGVDTTFVQGLYVPYWWSTGANVSTNLYAIVQPRIFGLNAIRHRMSPSIGVEYRPDFSDPSYGYYDQFFNPVFNTVDPYSIFEADGSVAQVPPRGESRSVTWSLDNSFEAKIAQGDTLQDRKITLLNLRMNGSHNFADSLFPWSTVNVFANTSLGSIGTISANATLDPYGRDTLGRRIEGGLSFPWVRVSTASVTFSTEFTNKGFDTREFIASREDTGRLTRSRFDLRHQPFDDREFWGERIHGNGRFRIPWRVSFDGTYTLTPEPDGDVRTNFNVNTRFSFSLTPTTEISSSANYDLEAGRFNIPQLTLRKDLHDWEMMLQWNPTGLGAGILFRIAFTPSLFRDLEYQTEF